MTGGIGLFAEHAVGFAAVIDAQQLAVGGWFGFRSCTTVVSADGDDPMQV